MNREQIKGNMETYIREGLLKKDPSARELAGIYLQNAERSFATAQLLLSVSDSSELKKLNKIEPDFDSYI